MAEISRDKFKLNKINGVNRKNKPDDIKSPIPDPTPAPAPVPTEQETKTSLNNHPGEVLGRSQVKKFNFNRLSAEQAENIRKDLAFFGKNTDLVNKSEKMYDVTFNNAKNNSGDPYKIATQVQMGYINEMKKD